MATEHAPGAFALGAVAVLVAARRAVRSISEAQSAPPERRKAALFEAEPSKADFCDPKRAAAASGDQAQFEDTSPDVWSLRPCLPDSDLRP